MPPDLPSQTLTSQDTVIVTRVLKILREQYIPYVKEAIIWLEVYSRERSQRAIYELKDALDHIAIASQSTTSPEEALKSLNAVEEHFRRAAVEPIEWIALEELMKLLKIKQRGLWWWKLFLLKPLDSKEFDEKIFKGQALIVKGRHFKGISIANAYDSFKEAYTIFHELLKEIRPAELNGRIFAIVFGLACLILGGIISWAGCAYFYTLQLHTSLSPIK
ncbi:MAG: hypothetical protein Q8O30_03310 [Candidatus Omnitrophota bacterium]|nr:hypothetical protein [Candidatus Omnitrophota bacterium]